MWDEERERRGKDRVGETGSGVLTIATIVSGPQGNSDVSGY